LRVLELVCDRIAIAVRGGERSPKLVWGSNACSSYRDTIHWPCEQLDTIFAKRLTMDQSHLTRREFAGLAVATTVPLLLAPTIEAAPLQTQPVSTEVQALADLIRARYGKHLDEDQLKRVRTRIEGLVRAADRLRKVTVGQDDPAFVFQADVP
jgi:hypothetical protein